MLAITEKSMPKTNPSAAIDSLTRLIRRISRVPVTIERTEKGRRRSGKRVSGWRRASQPQLISENTTKATKIPRQPPNQIIPVPSSGAIAGTRVNTIMAKDTTWAIWRPR